MTTHHFSRGFTLIELMIAVTISILLISGGLAAYIQLNNRQLLINSTRELQLLMRTAQKEARVGSKPTGCTQLQSYRVQINAANPTIARLSAICQNTSYVLQTLSFAQGVRSQSAIVMYFGVLAGGVKGSGTVTLVRKTQTAAFTVSEGGDISDITVQ